MTPGILAVNPQLVVIELGGHDYNTDRKLMNRQQSFVPSDFSFRDVPFLFLGFIITSVGTVAMGLTLDALPPFWGGVLSGIGIGIAIPLLFLRKTELVDIANYPQLSENVRMICDDPSCSQAEAVKAYCDETGLNISEGKAVVEAYQSQNA